MSVDPVARGLGARANTSAGISAAGGALVETDVSGNPVAVIGANGQEVGVSAAILESPDVLPNLQLWLDAQQPMFTASYAAQCTTLGDAVGIWPEQSGFGILPQPTGSPTYDPTGINGHPAVDFHGNSKFTATALMTSAYASALTVYVVAKTKTALSAEKILVATVSPNFWVGADGANTKVDVTYAGITPGPTGIGASNSVDTLDGVYGLSISASEVRFLQNRNFAGLGGSIATGVTAITGSIAFTGQNLIIGSQGSSFYWPDYIGEVIVYNASHTAEQMRQVNDYLVGKWGFSAKPLVLCGGNSLTAGTDSSGGATQNISASGTNYPGVMLGLSAGAWDVRTDAYPGRTTAQMIAEMPAYGDRMYFPSTGQKQVCVIWEITNTLAATRSRTSAYRLLVRCCKARRALGFKVVVVTGLLRQDSVYAGFALDMAATNVLIRADYADFADGIADVAARSELSNPLNTTYFNADKVHLTDAGYVVVATVVKAAVDIVLAA